MTKDLYQNLYIRKNRMNLIANYLVIAMTIVLIKNVFGFIFPTLIYIPFIMTPTLLQVSSERDVISSYDKIQLTMPVTKNDVVKAKYILGVFFSLFNTVVLFFGLMIHVYIYQSVSLKQGAYILLASFILSVISLAINYLSFIFLGSKGVLVYAGIIVTVMIGYFWNPNFLNIDQLITGITAIQPIIIFIIGTVLSVFFLLLSYFCATWYYSKKEFN